jgi:surface antigen
MTYIVAAAAALLVAPVAASAQPYNYGVSEQCQQSVNNNRLAGGAIGAIAGAVFGKQVAARNARKEGQVLGAVVGAVAGSELGRRRLACDDAAYRNAPPPPRVGEYRPSTYGYHDQNAYRDQGGYRDPRDYSHQVYYEERETAQTQCRWADSFDATPSGIHHMRRPTGITQLKKIWMCQSPDGRWYPAER